MCESERFSTITEFLRFVQKESCDIDIDTAWKDNHCNRHGSAS